MKHSAAKILVVASVLAGCHEPSNHPADLNGKQVYKTVSPDGQVTAVVLEGGFGATVGAVSSVRVIFNGGSSEVYRADNVRDLKIRWRDAGNLEVTSECGRIFSFTNFADLIGNGTLIRRINVRLGNSGLCSSNPVGNRS